MTTVKVAQHAERLDGTYWRWAVWLEGDGAALDKVKEVVWTLHPSFSPPVQTARSRADKFRLEASGWGEFEISAKVVGVNGRSKRLTHGLTLREDGEAAVASAKTSSSSKARSAKAKAAPPSEGRGLPRLFLSYPVNNAGLAAQLAEALKSQRYEVTRDIDIPAGIDFRAWSREQVAHSDAVVLLGADDVSMGRCPEIKVARAEGVPIVPVAFSGKSLPESLSDVEAVRIRSSRPDRVVQQVVSALEGLPRLRS